MEKYLRTRLSLGQKKYRRKEMPTARIGAVAEAQGLKVNGGRVDDEQRFARGRGALAARLGTSALIGSKAAGRTGDQQVPVG
jgi:hypothetical protein